MIGARFTQKSPLTSWVERGMNSEDFLEEVAVAGFYWTRRSWVFGRKAPTWRGRQRQVLGVSLWVGQSRLLTLRRGGCQLFRAEFLKSRPGTQLLWHETFRFPGITQIL